ncbi:MAG: cyclic nucleotide-binding domain-containing protein [Muribaculaceae bacterium]|nr:cyclic nucleotide-binding domain-containing protein [Muribaculaceae bacterium]
MATMYETIMDLPLFKGVGKDHVSQFLEKTPIMFCNYRDGEIISTPGEEVKMIKFIISGEVKICNTLESLDLTVVERSGSGRVLGADRLFGISTGYPFKIIAAGNTSIMQFKKEQYMNLLYSDRIYMLNFFNYLSLRAQRPTEAVSIFAEGDITGILRRMVAILTDPVAKEVSIEGTVGDLARYCGVDVDKLRNWITLIEGSGMVKREPGRLIIHSREKFLE